ncbi:MAG: chromosome segregation protein SMC [Balneolaceae bacterium]|nr:chromosome segregation protein SMC [Balneolaceae bacterium]
MYISELELQGFKSFAYKTRIRFDSGITAIVGPNGCGKSNVVDAMRWVLGEQRPTMLRSSTMSNVIFNGTSKKNALGMAEVDLTFVNNKGLLPTEYNEVTISRRLYRSGESEYLINGTTCRLKDIHDLFMDTGMSSDAYSVIELKMVEEILNDRNNDRRRLFEEAAGVTRYKDKRKKTFRKLDDTMGDLQRLEDILSEVRKKVNSLEKQAEKAKAAKEYREELTFLDKALHRFEYANIQEELEPLQERIANAEKEKKEIMGSAEELEQAAEKARATLTDKEREQSEAQRRVNQLQSSIRDLETSLKITREKISNEEGVIGQYTKDIEQGEADLEELRGLFKSTRKKLEGFDSELERAENNLEASKERYAEIQKEFTEAREELEKLEKERARCTEKIGELQNRRVRLESRIENSEDDDERIAGEIDGLEKRIEEIAGEREELKKKHHEAAESRDRQEKKRTEARGRREELSRRVEELKEKRRGLRSNLDSLQSEIELLQELAASNEAFPAGVRYLLEEHAGNFETLEVLSELISTDQAHAVALEAALGEALNYVVVESLEDARRAARLLKEHEKGSATFVPLDRLSDDYESLEGSLAGAVDCPDRCRPLARLLLGHVKMYDTVEQAWEEVAVTRGAGVTPEGEVVTSGRFLKSGSTGRNAGIRVGLRDRIESLEDRAGAARSDLDDLEKELGEVQEERGNIDVQALETDLREREQEVRGLETKLSELDSRQEIYRKNIEELRGRREKVGKDADELREELGELEPRRRELEQRRGELTERQEARRGELKELEEERSIAQNRYNDARLKHQDLKNKVENHEKEIRRAESGIASLKERLEHRSEKTEEARERIREYKSSIAESEEQLEALKQKKNEADKELEAAEESSAKARGRINEVEKELKEVRRRKEVNMELIHHLSMAREKFEMQAENLSDHIWETYDMLMDQIEVELPEDRKPDEVKERLAFLRQKLNKIGEVNPLAIEEYEEEKERLDFYEEQIGDLRQAEEELRETIEEINKTATERFNTTFEKIRENFVDVFQTLFSEDDHCDLVIDEEAEDPLEATIEIKANPRGKRPSTINQLSGGEKTLTAIALLFSIYLVKPSPFCVLDEVDAPLDDANIERFAAMIKRFSQDTQFIIITHNKKTMSKAEMMYGITMPETGISRLVGVKMDEVTEA